jgi:protein-tyrosine phosphatase
MATMIDLHCHILPGLDDGPDTLDESAAMGRIYADAGYDRVVATPHCMPG